MLNFGLFSNVRAINLYLYLKWEILNEFNFNIKLI